MLLNYALKHGNSNAALLKIVDGELSAPLLELIVDRGQLDLLEQKFQNREFFHVLVDCMNSEE